jgi:uncharacterized protein
MFSKVKVQKRFNPSVTALIEILIMFLPAIPAYLWMWPAISPTDWLMPVQIGVYLYFLAGSLLIGLRRWNFDQLGLNRRGWGVSLTCGGIFILALIAGRLAINVPIAPKPLTFQSLVFDILFYFGMVGLVEELLFRGVIYRALLDWRGVRLAIWGSALAFGVYHVGWQGVIGGVGTFICGLFLAAIRWRAGGIMGLIVIHGLYDTIALGLWPTLRVSEVSQVQIIHPVLGILADGLFLILFLYLWKLYPRLSRI